jgi:two-component system sensor histidine kinase HydH
MQLGIAKMKESDRTASPPARAEGPAVGTREAVAGVGLLAGELVHALRNPVSALTTSLELLLGGRVDAEDLPHLHRVMRNELTRLNDLLARCSELARLRELAFAPLDLVALVHDRLEARAHELTSRGLTLALTLPTGTAMLRADETQLGGAVDALVSNALEAMPAGGTLTVRLERDEPANELQLVVGDTGAGIATTALANVFRLFYSTKPGAAGMGLPVARQVITAHGGTVALTSEPGRGTTVTVRLPMGSAESSEGAGYVAR